MKLTLVQTATFVSLWQRLKLDDEDLQSLEQALIENPLRGKVMKNTGGVRKMRFAPPSRGSGKSGAFRVCYLHFPRHDAVYFLLIFPKNEQSNLTAEQEKACRLIARQIKSSLD